MRSAYMQSTEALINALKAGTDPTLFGRIGTSARKMTNIGTTNGAAMRVAPVGMAFPGDIGLRFEVVDMDGNRVDKLLISRRTSS